MSKEREGCPADLGQNASPEGALKHVSSLMAAFSAACCTWRCAVTIWRLGGGAWLGFPGPGQSSGLIYLPRLGADFLV